MSGSSSIDDEFSNGDGYEGGGSDSDDDEDKKKNHRTTKMGCGGFRKEVVLHPFTKAKNQIRRIKSRKPLLASSSSKSLSNSTAGKKVITTRVDGDGAPTGTGCKFCFSRPLVLETPNLSPISDPNHPNFTHAMLKNLIQNNDFYCKECNPHLD